MARRSNLLPCPRCGSRRRRRIIWGLIGPPLLDDPDDSVVFGGCFIPEDPPTHQCNDCEMRYIADRRDLLEFDERLTDDSHDAERQ